MSQVSNTLQRVYAPGLPQIAGAFCHATVTGNTIHISGTIGTVLKDPSLDSSVVSNFELVQGGIAEQTTQTLKNISSILKACGSNIHNLTKLNVFLKNNNPERYAEMNEAYVRFFRERDAEVCARITVGCGNLALGSDVEIDGNAILNQIASKL